MSEESEEEIGASQEESHVENGKDSGKDRSKDQPKETTEGPINPASTSSSSSSSSDIHSVGDQVKVDAESESDEDSDTESHSKVSDRKKRKRKRSKSERKRKTHKKNKKRKKRNQSSEPGSRSRSSSVTTSSSSTSSSIAPSTSTSSKASVSSSSSKVKKKHHHHHKHRKHHHHHHHHHHRNHHHGSESDSRTVAKTAKQLKRQLGKKFDVLDKKMSAEKQEELNQKYTRSKYPIPLVKNLPTNDKVASGGARMRDEAHKDIIEQARLAQKIIAHIAVKAKEEGISDIGEAAGDALDVLYNQQTVVHRERQIDQIGAESVKDITGDEEEDWISTKQRKRLRKRAKEQRQLEEVRNKARWISGKGESHSSGSAFPHTYGQRKPFGSRGGNRSYRIGQPQQPQMNLAPAVPNPYTAPTSVPASAHQQSKKWKGKGNWGE